MPLKHHSQIAAHRPKRTHTIAKISMVAAVYAALTLILAPLSFGAVQIRFAEALTVFACVSPVAAAGLTLGCFIANLAGFLIGLNPMPLDILFGTAATCLAAFGTYRLRAVRYKDMPVLAWLPPVLCNGLILGAEFSFLYVSPDAIVGPALFMFNFSSVAIGELISCLVVGMPLFYILRKRLDLNTLLR